VNFRTVSGPLPNLNLISPRASQCSAVGLLLSMSMFLADGFRQVDHMSIGVYMVKEWPFGADKRQFLLGSSGYDRP